MLNLEEIKIKILTDSKQHFVKIDDTKSSVLTSDTGASQCCVLSPFLFSVYTNSVSSAHCNLI